MLGIFRSALFLKILIVLAIVLGSSTFLHQSDTAVYALEQTVEAIRNVSVVHILGKDWDDKNIEIWGKVNPDTGLMEYWHVRHIDDGHVLLSTPRNTFICDEQANTVRIQDGLRHADAHLRRQRR